METHAYSLQIWTPNSTRLSHNLNQSCGRRRCIINMGSGHTLCVGDSPAPGPRREPAQLMVVPFIGQGHLGSDEQDLPTGQGTRVSLRWTRPVMRCSPPRQWTMSEQLRPSRCVPCGCARGTLQAHLPSTDLPATPLYGPKPHPLLSLFLNWTMLCQWQQEAGEACPMHRLPAAPVLAKDRVFPEATS